MIPGKIYSKKELPDYAEFARAKFRLLIDSLKDEKSLDIRFTEGNQRDDMDYPVLEILLYNLRHTQHHVGQLNVMIRRDLGKHMEWVFRVDELS